MSANGWFQIALFFAVVFVLTKPVGEFLVRVFNRERNGTGWAGLSLPSRESK